MSRTRFWNVARPLLLAVAGFMIGALLGGMADAIEIDARWEIAAPPEEIATFVFEMSSVKGGPYNPTRKVEMQAETLADAARKEGPGHFPLYAFYNPQRTCDLAASDGNREKNHGASSRRRTGRRSAPASSRSRER